MTEACHKGDTNALTTNDQYTLNITNLFFPHSSPPLGEGRKVATNSYQYEYIYFLFNDGVSEV